RDAGLPHEVERLARVGRLRRAHLGGGVERLELAHGSATTAIAAASSFECVIERSISPALTRSPHAFVQPESCTPGFGRPAISISRQVKWTPQPSALPIASLPAKRA